MKILYIEDEPNDAILVSLFLDGTNHQLVVVRNTDEAQDVITNEPNLILLDINLRTRYEGCEFVEQVRKAGYHKPVIALTALATSEDRAACQRAGVTHILNKPFVISQLAEVLQLYLA